MHSTGAIAALTRQGKVADVIRDAAARTGIDFSYLMAQARVESGFDPAARAATSSAAGLYQFTKATWLETVRKHGADHGLGWAADAIASGVARAGSAAQETILALRSDARAAALMAGEFAADNGAALEARLGHAVGATELYVAHFLGAGGATKFLDTLRDAPATAAASLFPAAAAANRGIFYDRSGAARSLAQVYAGFERKLAVTPPVVPPGDVAASASLSAGGRGQTVPATGTVLPVEASRARLAYLLLAELGG